jgi:hypothetical protein
MHRGSCLCESIQYEVESDLRPVVNCHCQFCSKAHGAPFITLLFMPFAALKIVAGEDFVARHHVENIKADRCFCGKCGTRLYNHAPQAGMISLVVATLAGSPPLRPLAHINTGSKCDWFQITDALPQFASMPSPAEFGQLISAARAWKRARADAPRAAD